MKCSGQLSAQTSHTHLSFPFLFRGLFCPAAISIFLFGLLHYANWISSIPAQIIRSCQKDYHIIKGKTFLNFNQPGLITMYMQMLNFTSFFLHPAALDHFLADETLVSLISGSDCLLSKPTGFEINTFPVSLTCFNSLFLFFAVKRALFALNLMGFF